MKTQQRKLLELKLPGSLVRKCENAAEILRRSRDSADAMLDAFYVVRKKRGSPRGTLPDKEQDLLRAMLMMAAGGMDSMLKQLIRDATPTLAGCDNDVDAEIQKFVTRTLRGDEEQPGVLQGTAFLGRILTAPSTRQAVIEERIRELTGESLQSVEKLFEAVKALGLKDTKPSKDALAPIFEARRRIVHELDIKLEGDRRKRHERGLEEMVKWTNALLRLSQDILSEVNQKLTQRSTSPLRQSNGEP